MINHYQAIESAGRWVFTDKLKPALIEDADLVTNSGHLRPFKWDFINGLKDTAVIPLMWESWEMRDGEIDLVTARDKGILVLGTNEHEPPSNMRPYSFLTALHLAMAHEVGLIEDKILVIGDQYILAHSIAEGFSKIDIECRLVSVDNGKKVLDQAIKWATYIIVAEHVSEKLLIGPGGLIEVKQLIDSGILAVGLMAGQVDLVSMKKDGISVFPDRVSSPGFINYLPSELGPCPVMDLFAAGLKVGEVACRARKRGLSPSAAAKFAIENSPAMDLHGEFAWT
jgi:hypothetical protein